VAGLHEYVIFEEEPVDPLLRLPELLQVEVSSPQLTMTTEFVDLGEPQVIERPQPDTIAGP
jgi:hypothetical protein